MSLAVNWALKMIKNEPMTERENPLDYFDPPRPPTPTPIPLPPLATAPPQPHFKTNEISRKTLRCAFGVPKITIKESETHVKSIAVSTLPAHCFVRALTFVAAPLAGKRPAHPLGIGLSLPPTGPSRYSGVLLSLRSASADLTDHVGHCSLSLSHSVFLSLFLCDHVGHCSLSLRL